MPLVLPKRCPNCGRKCTKTPDGDWLCDPQASGCGWTDDPNIIRPTLASATEASPNPTTES